MKKIYLQPSTNVVLVTVERVIAVSGQGLTFDNNGNGEVETQSEDAIGEAMSRFWDDED